MGVSIWIVPPPEAAANLKTLMRVPPSLGPLPYDAPEFYPHITLATFPITTPKSVLRSAIDVAAREITTTTVHESESSGTSTAGAIAGIPLHVIYDALATGDHFFRSVLLDITPSEALVAFRARVLEAVEALIPDTAHPAQSPRFPHLSLFYIPDDHAEYRERICDALSEKYTAPRQQHGSKSDGENDIVLNLQSDAGVAGFDATDAWIVLCDGPVEGWKVLDKVSLV